MSDGLLVHSIMHSLKIGETLYREQCHAFNYWIQKDETQKGHSGDAEKLFEWPNTQQKLLLVAAFCSKKDIGTLLEGFFDQQEWKCI